MKRFLLLVLILIITVTACNEKSNKEVSSDQNESFDSFKEDFVLELWKQNPSWASWAGLHQYDSILNTNSLENRQELLSSIKEMETNLHTFEQTNLDDGNKIDYHIIENFIETEAWYINEFKSYEWDASNYNVAGRVWTIMNGTYADLDTRLDILSALLVKVPSFYQSAINNLKKPTLEHLKKGLVQNKGGLGILDDGLLDSISHSSLSDKKKDLLRLRVNESKDAISNYISTLETLQLEVDNGSARSSRIGQTLFAKKYELEINSDYTADQIYKKALQEKEALHQQMIVISDTLWNHYLMDIEKPTDKIIMVKMLIDKIAEKHVSREDFFKEINRQIPILSAFVKDNDLLTQDPSKPLVVRETPPYMRGGGSGASVSSPGPYEKGKKTYYNVTPLDAYSAEEAESYLREYNYYILQILNIHEAIPGHYTQLVYGNESPSIIKSILGNGAMIEGWANYAEIMMLEEGYNNSPEMWLMRHKWHLRGVTNTILDYSYHVLNLQKEDAMKLMIKDAFQEKTEAENKWRRVTLSSAQLSSYFTGFSQIYELRDEIKAIKGDSFNLKEFHEQFLSYGNAPVKHIRELMIKIN